VREGAGGDDACPGGVKPPLECGGVEVKSGDVPGGKVFGAISEPPPAMAMIGLAPRVSGGYAPAAAAAILWEGRRLWHSAEALDSVVDTIDATLLSGDAQGAIARSLSRVAGCLAARLEEEAGVDRLERPEWEPRAAFPGRAIVVYPGRRVEVPAPAGAWLGLVPWLAWAERVLRECTPPHCPGLDALHAYARILSGPAVEEHLRRAAMRERALIPLRAAGGARVEAAAVPGEGVSPAEYAAAAQAEGAVLLVPPPPPRPVDRLALALAVFALARRP